MTIIIYHTRSLSIIDFCVSPLATIEELATTHDRKYIHRFMNGDQTEKEQRNVGFPWSVAGVNRALSSVGGTLAAACHVCEVWKREQQQQHQHPQSLDHPNPSVPLVIAPWSGHIAGGTHHAFYDYGEGFSVFSDIAVAVNVVLDRYSENVLTKQKILIIDLDVHQGNGNAVLFQNDPRVLTFSIHCEGNYFSPKQQSDLDIELPIGCTDSLYLSTLNHWLNYLKREIGSQLDMIFFQAGIDIVNEDRLGRMNITPMGVQKRNTMVYKFADELNIPLVISMGGGYPKSDDGWEVILQSHTDVYVQAYRYYQQRMERRRRNGNNGSDFIQSTPLSSQLK
jgi:acetoin utilization deacetylase AcuC-like enzyme